MSKKQIPLDESFIPDMERYRKCAEPHASVKEAHAAIEAFYADLSELRVKHRIRDIYVVYNVAMIEDDGTEGIQCGSSGLGTQSLWLSMLAAAYGSEKQRHDSMIRKMLGGNPGAT